MSLKRRTHPHRKPRKHAKRTKITLIGTGSALALVAVVAGTTAAWPGSSDASGNMADAAAFAGSHASASSVAAQAVQAQTSQQLRAIQSAAVRAQLRQQAAQARARKAARARAAAAAKAAAARKAARASQASSGSASSSATPQGSPQQIAESMLGSYGWSSAQFSCLQPLWNEESGWNVYANNPTSGAYGIPQALPGSKMASAGADWQTDAATQIRWGLGYIRSTYGSPCAAWAHEQAYGWY